MKMQTSVELAQFLLSVFSFQLSGFCVRGSACNEPRNRRYYRLTLAPKADFKEDAMGTGRTLNKKPRTRPVKSEGERRRRQKVQKKRLIGLGVAVADAQKLAPETVRIMLKRPAKVKLAVARKAAKAAAAAV
jgi:hypothetical protein